MKIRECSDGGKSHVTYWFRNATQTPGMVRWCSCSFNESLCTPSFKNCCSQFKNLFHFLSSLFCQMVICRICDTEIFDLMQKKRKVITLDKLTWHVCAGAKFCAICFVNLRSSTCQDKKKQSNIFDELFSSFGTNVQTFWCLYRFKTKMF